MAPYSGLKKCSISRSTLRVLCYLADQAPRKRWLGAPPEQCGWLRVIQRLEKQLFCWVAANEPVSMASDQVAGRACRLRLERMECRLTVGSKVASGSASNPVTCVPVMRFRRSAIWPELIT